jgi:hypothetical protein
MPAAGVAPAFEVFDYRWSGQPVDQFGLIMAK